MVAFLKKPQGSEDFHQIVDFLNGSYISIKSTVDGQDKTITEASIMRHIKLADADGISTLPTIEIFEQLALMGVETTLFPTMLVNEQLSPGEDEAITKEMHDGLGMATTTASSLEVEQGSGKVTTLENELSSTKAIHNKALITLTKRVKKLEKNLKLKKRSAVVDSSKDEEASLHNEDSSKQGRMIEEINEDENVNLVKSKTVKDKEQERYDFEKALELQKQLDEREKVVAKSQARDIDWSDPVVLRYHAVQNRAFSIAEVRKNNVYIIKESEVIQVQSSFQGMSYEGYRLKLKEVNGIKIMLFFARLNEEVGICFASGEQNGEELGEMEESMTMKKVGDQMIGVIRRRRIDKEGNVSRFQEYHTSDKEEEEFSEHPPYNKYGFVDHPATPMEDQRKLVFTYP
ncbi:hypothetical protein Tco_0150655 [Tanacetum coccineum]